MREMIRKISTLLVIAVAILSLSACGTTGDKTAYEQKIEEYIAEDAQSQVENIVSLDDETLDYYITEYDSYGQSAYVEGFNNWKSIKDDLGEFLAVEDMQISESDDGYVVTMVISCANREGKATIGYDGQTLAVSSLAFNRIDTVSEKMVSASKNLLIGMISVFSVLILMTLLIYAFRLIGGKDKDKHDKGSGISSSGTSGGNISKTTQSGPTVATIQLIDDSQLIAVISAAIAAYSGTSAGQLIVRSIRRVGKSNWKNANK